MAITPELKRTHKIAGVSFAMAIGIGTLALAESSTANSQPTAAVTHMAKLSINQTASQDAPPPIDKKPMQEVASTTTEALATTSTSTTIAPAPPTTAVSTSTVPTTMHQIAVVAPPTTLQHPASTSYNGSKYSWMAAAGIPAADYNYVDYIASNESGWCATINEGQRSCPGYADWWGGGSGYGLCQSSPGNKMATYGADWETDPVTQLKWCNAYATSTYGGWYNAYIHWESHRNW